MVEYRHPTISVGHDEKYIIIKFNEHKLVLDWVSARMLKVDLQTLLEEWRPTES